MDKIEGLPQDNADDPLLGESRLNPNYTYNSFVVGPSNSFAHAASFAVSQAPAKAYNPLFIYGDVGLGKTHLMQAIGHHVSGMTPGSRVIYISSEKFTNQLINALQNRTMIKFRNKYRSVDVLLIDDVHFLGGKEQTQEEFFHTFNTLYDSHRQIVLSSDRPPKEIADLEERLVSRFEWGLITDLQPPDFEMRIAILKKKAEFSNFNVPEDLCIFLAEKIKSNVRKLEGALLRVVSYSSISGEPLSVSLAESLLQDLIVGEEKPPVGIELIQRRVAEYYDIRISDMVGKKRPRAIAFPRQVAMYLSRVMTNFSLPDIGEAFGGRDHTTVLHAFRLVDGLKENDAQLRRTLSVLQQRIREEA